MVLRVIGTQHQRQPSSSGVLARVVGRTIAFLSMVAVAIVVLASPASAAVSSTPHVYAEFNLVHILAVGLHHAVGAIVDVCVEIIQSSPEPNLLALWYRGQYHLMFNIALYMTIISALIATVVAVLKGGLKEVVRIYLVAIPVAVFGGIVAIAIVTLAQRIDQAMTDAVLTHTNQYFTAFTDNFANQDPDLGTDLSEIGTALLQVVLYLLILITCAFLWVELVIRQVMIYTSVLFIPLALATFVWPPLRGWLFALAEIVLTMVMSKFIIACIMSFGFLAINNGLTDFGLFVGGFLTLITACLSVPALIFFVMSPRTEILDRRTVSQLSPLGADRSYARHALGGALQGLKPGSGGKAPSGPARG